MDHEKTNQEKHNKENELKHGAEIENESTTKGERQNGFRTLLEVLGVSIRLGFTSFGGPIAHLGYFRDEYVRRKKWLDDRSYTDLVALCQFLPGPASSQVGIGIGMIRAGLWGGLISFIGFTLPSVVALVIFALFVQGFDIEQASWIYGLKIVAVAIVAQAVLGMAQKLTPDRNRQTIAILAVILILLWPTAFTQVAVIILAGLLGFMLYRNEETPKVSAIHMPFSRTFGFVCLGLFFAFLIALPILSGWTSSYWVAVFDSFYRAGSLVFGGGHVVLPLLEREVVPVGWVDSEAFLAGYGAAQAVPGPLFTFAAYLGAMMNGWLGALVATVAIFLPAFLLIMGTLPFWGSLRQNPNIQGALFGVNAAVVGILVSALYDPIWTSSILAPVDFALASVLFGMLVFWKLPPWIAVLSGALGGTLISLL